MNECRPPSSAIRSSPGRKCRWYALPSRIVVPSARSSSGSTVFTVAFVPTGMNAGVGTSPCTVRSTPARAAPSVAASVNRSLIDAHVAPVGDEVAAMLETEVLVVGADPGSGTEAVEPQAPAALCRRGRVGLLDDPVAHSPPGPVSDPRKPAAVG